MEYVILLLLAQICLIYYFVCGLYAGFSSSFIFIWLIGSMFFAVLLGARICQKRELISIPTGVLLGSRVIIVTGFVIFVILEALITSSMFQKPDGNCKYLIVLGCQIRGDHITKSLTKRLDTAYDYAVEHENVTIVVSGGKGTGEDVTEASAMRAYLIKKGIDENRILMEDQSENTDQNMRNSAELIGDKTAKIGIVTSNYHLFRSKLLARAKGMNNICGISSPSDPILFANYMVREAIGVVKDFVAGNFFA